METMLLESDLILSIIIGRKSLPNVQRVARSAGILYLKKKSVETMNWIFWISDISNFVK